jgi:hypothetical protein
MLARVEMARDAADGDQLVVGRRDSPSGVDGACGEPADHLAVR